MSEFRIKSILYTKLVLFSILSFIPHCIELHLWAQRGYRTAKNDLRNLNIDKMNKELKDKGINLKNWNKRL